MQWNLMLYPYKIQAVQMLTAASKQQRHEFYWGFLHFVQQYLTTLEWLWFSDEDHFHLGFMNKQNTRFWASENPNRAMETSLHPAKCTMWCAISKQGLIGPICVEGTVKNQRYLQKLQNKVIPVIQTARHVDTKFFQQAGTCLHTANVVLDVL
jgi:hypothetical protein